MTDRKMSYLLLIYASRPVDSELSPSDTETTLVGHRALQAESKAKGELHAVAKLVNPAGARTVRRRGKRHVVTDGPFMETKEWLVGVYMLDCADEDQAIARAQMLLPDDHHAIEVRPVQWAWTSSETA